jgi:hypothetical protein
MRTCLGEAPAARIAAEVKRRGPRRRAAQVPRHQGGNLIWPGCWSGYRTTAGSFVRLVSDSENELLSRGTGGHCDDVRAVALAFNRQTHALLWMSCPALVRLKQSRASFGSMRQVDALTSMAASRSSHSVRDRWTPRRVLEQGGERDEASPEPLGRSTHKRPQSRVCAKCHERSCSALCSFTAARSLRAQRGRFDVRGPIAPCIFLFWSGFGGASGRSTHTVK